MFLSSRDANSVLPDSLLRFRACPHSPFPFKAGVPGHPKRSAATPQAAALQNIAGLALVIDHEPVEWRDCRLTS